MRFFITNDDKKARNEWIESKKSQEEKYAEEEVARRQRALYAIKGSYLDDMVDKLCEGIRFNYRHNHPNCVAAKETVFYDEPGYMLPTSVLSSEKGGFDIQEMQEVKSLLSNKLQERFGDSILILGIDLAIEPNYSDEYPGSHVTVGMEYDIVE